MKAKSVEGRALVFHAEISAAELQIFSSHSRWVVVRGLSSSSSVSGPEHHSSPLYGCFFSRTQRRLLRMTPSRGHRQAVSSSLPIIRTCVQQVRDGQHRKSTSSTGCACEPPADVVLLLHEFEIKRWLKHLCE